MSGSEVTLAPLSGKIPHHPKCELAREQGRPNVWGPACVACMYEHGFRDGLGVCRAALTAALERPLDTSTLFAIEGALDEIGRDRDA